ncbi:MAG: alpha-galactosidase [Spirochaetaceae bacterium]|nr:alpha-galactosidase [Spirochaetaceae bacterium]
MPVVTGALFPSEVWVELHYRYKGELFQFNLPMHHGEKFLDGLRLDFAYEDIPDGRRFTLVLEPLGEVFLDSFELTGGMKFGDEMKSVFVNGFQSWTGSRERSPGERISGLNWPGKMMSMHRYGDAVIYPYSEKKGRFHGYSYAYIRYPEHLLFAGSLDESAGYTIITTDVRRDFFSVKKDVTGLSLKSKRKLIDIVLFTASEERVFDRFMELRGHAATGLARATAWTSWHSEFRAIDELKIRRSLSAFRERRIPWDYFIIDDGWQRETGDWDTPSTGFASGMASLAAEIRGSGYKPGIWCAPFMVSPDSAVFRTKKTWLARTAKGRIRPAAWLPKHGGILYALDISKDEVKTFVAETIKRFRDSWGFEFIKLDLLYAAALYPPQGYSRGEAMNMAMDFLQSVKGEAVYQVSAVPLESAFHRAEYCRTTADTTPYWEHIFHRNIHGRERASTLNALRSTVGRRELNGRFFTVDTDSFFLQERSKVMESSRRYTQILLQSLLGGLLSTSDDISALDEDALRMLQSIFPVTDPEIHEVVESRRTVTIRYRVAGRHFTSISNLAERVRPLVLPEGFWFCASGLKRRAHHVTGGGRQILKPGESRNYMLFNEGDPFAGSDGHIFPGREIASIAGPADDWIIRPDPGVMTDFRVWMRVGTESHTVRINGVEADIIQTPYGVKLASAVVRINTDEASD